MVVVDDEETGQTMSPYYTQPPPAGRGSCVPVDDDNDDNENDAEHDNDNNDNDEDENEDEMIAGCVVGSFVEASTLSKTMRSLLISDPTRHSRLFYIMTLGTVPEYRKIGLGSALVQECIIDKVILQQQQQQEQEQQHDDNHNTVDVENSDKCGTCYLHVITSNHAAIRFYEKLGFYRVLQIDDYYDINGEKHACFLYAKYFHGNRGHRDVFKMLSRALWSVWKHVTTSVINTALLVSSSSSNSAGTSNSSSLSLGETIAAAIAAGSSSISLSSEEEILEP
jgi:ribosomal protein S18 acetylase RimI-like enzyme